MDNKLNEKNNFIIYTTDDGQVDIEVRLEDENVWLTQNSMAELFDTTKQNISLHIKNIFEEKELEENSVVKHSLTTDKEEKNYKTKFYNLDLIRAYSVAYDLSPLHCIFRALFSISATLLPGFGCVLRNSGTFEPPFAPIFLKKPAAPFALYCVPHK